MLKTKKILLMTALLSLLSNVSVNAEEGVFVTEILHNDFGSVSSVMVANNIKKKEFERKKIVQETDTIVSAHTEQSKQQAKLDYEASLYQLDETYWTIPRGLGNSHTYTIWDKISWGSDCKRAIKTLGGSSKSEGGYITYSSEGFVKYGTWYAVAMTSTFGNVGDMVLIVQDDDTVYPVMIADHKCQSYTSYDSNPANVYGHLEGRDMVEFEVTRNQTIYKGSGSNAGSQFAHYIKKVINVGNIYDNPDYIENADLVFRSSSVKDLIFIPVKE